MKLRFSSQRCAGFTAPEVVVASALLAIIVSTAILLSMFAGRSFASMTNYIDLDSKSRNALDVMIREIRQAKQLTYYTNNAIRMTDLADRQVGYSWNESSGELWRTVNGLKDSKPLLTGCEWLNFKIYQRTPSLNHEFYETASNISQAKLLNVSWVCARSVLGKKINTESVQTTKIVIRNQKVLY
jgi:prepilin-type N-terminal cleavage/methylation domain-containing protein